MLFRVCTFLWCCVSLDGLGTFFFPEIGCPPDEDDEDVEGEEGSGSDGPPVQHVVSFRRNRAGMADQFEKQKQLKTEWEEAIRVFKDSPKKASVRSGC